MPFWNPSHPPLSTLRALDSALNTLWWSPHDKEQSGSGWGFTTETMSGRAGRLRYVSGFAAGLAWFLDHIQAYHTSKAIDHDELRGEQVREVEREAGEAQAEAVDEEVKETRDGTGRIR